MVRAPKVQTYGIIDIGTVKVKCLVATRRRDGSFRKRYSSNTLTCFGCNMGDSGQVVDTYLERTITELNRCREVFEKLGVASYRVVSTHALRHANNKAEVVERIRQSTGFEVENISSEDEAALFFKAVLRDFPADRPYALVDMGGGSMQVIIGEQGKAESTYLLPIGSATLHEKFTRNSSEESSFNTPEDIEQMKEYILEQMIGIAPSQHLPIIYGSTNVIDLMVAIGLPLEVHDDSPTHPYKTYAHYLDDFIAKVLPFTFAEREARYQFQKGYMWGVDKAFATVATLSERLRSPYIIPSNANLAEGLLYSLVS